MLETSAQMAWRGRTADNALLADRGYDADAPSKVAIAVTQAVVPAKKGWRTPVLHDRRKYRPRNQIKRLFNKLMNWRRVATHYEKSKTSYLGSLASHQHCSGCPWSTKPNRRQEWACNAISFSRSRETASTMSRKFVTDAANASRSSVLIA